MAVAILKNAGKAGADLPFVVVAEERGVAAE
jgi:hypothetical protein